MELMREVEALFNEVERYFKEKRQIEDYVEQLPVVPERRYREVKSKLDTGLSPLRRVPPAKVKDMGPYVSLKGKIIGAPNKFELTPQ